MKYSTRNILGLVAVVALVLCLVIQRFNSFRKLRIETERVRSETEVTQSVNEVLLLFSVFQNSRIEDWDRLLHKELLYKLRELYLHKDVFADSDDVMALALELLTDLNVSSIDELDRRVQDCFVDSSVELFWMPPRDEMVDFERGFRRFVEEVMN